MNFEEYKKEAFKKNPELENEYETLAPEYEMITGFIKARLEKGLTQKQLAEKLGLPQSHISRLESGRYNPSVKYLQKIAEGLGKKVHITLEG